MNNEIMVINGPNLNLLGMREPAVYGAMTQEELFTMIRDGAAGRNTAVECYQSNHEGDIIDKIHSMAGRNYTGLVINPGAFTHYSYAIRDAISGIGVRAVEVHLSDVDNREPFRKISVVRDVCIDCVKGLGAAGYLRAMDLLLAGRLPTPV